ncbi:hypothetical protein CASFOL_006198 [Castilleja foliolosa]|uniref:Uncharacterized protein n=1 Tax=Castilleja foliolosa TaxID=1961234 RepID=A0ABD3E9L3_9LAMI
MDYQQPHGYMRPPPPPPPPSAMDPYQRPPSSVPPPPTNQPWSHPAPQFQYQPRTQHSPSPPSPQWPPPHSSEHAPYPPPPPYHAHQPPPYLAHPQYPPSHPLPPRPPHVQQSYSQDWGSGSWSHHQNWQYPTNNNEDDWGAKAKAWLAAKAATENQHPSSQFVTTGRPEEQNHFREQYSQSNDPQFHVPAPLAPASNYQQYPGAEGPPHRAALGQLQDSQYITSGQPQPSYTADMHAPFAPRDGSLAGDSIAPLKTLVNQQEGNGEAGDRYEKFNSSSSLPVAPLSQHHVQPMPPAGGRPGWMEEPHNFGSQPAESASDLSNQPLNFAPHFNRNLEPHAQPNYTYSSGGHVRSGDPISSNYAWPPSTAQGAAYQPLPPSIPPGAQVDHPIAMPTTTSVHSTPMFPAGHGFHPTGPMMGASFGVGAGVMHPTAFSGDTYGVSERPKKASVPNWLREEIIKNKAVITSSAPEILEEDSQSIEEDSNDNYSRKKYQMDSKSADSSRSTEDDDEDEDDVEAARTAAINQEIKRVLTEVLLKVTDELFDEIANKVLKEDDLSVDVVPDVDQSNHQISLSTLSGLTPRASAKVLIPIKTKESDYQDVSEKSTSGAPGDVLGLGSYASDEEDDEIQSSGKLNSKVRPVHQQSPSSRLLEGKSVDENGGILKPTVITNPDRTVNNVELSDHKAARDLASSDDRRSSKRLSSIAEDELQHGSDISKLNNSLIEKAGEKNEDHSSDAERLRNDDSRIQDTANRYDKNDRVESKKSSVKRDNKDPESYKERLDKKGNGEHGRRLKSEKMDHHDNSKDKGKEKGGADEKVKNTKSSKRLSPSGSTDAHQDKRASGKKDNNGRRQDRSENEKRGRSRHKSEGESSRHRRRSSSAGVRGRDSKDNLVGCRENDSSDESSDDARRKSHHSKRRKSPSPIRTRKRDKFRGLLIASTLSAGILPTLLLRPPGGKKISGKPKVEITCAPTSLGQTGGGTRLDLGEAKVFTRDILIVDRV